MMIKISFLTLIIFFVLCCVYNVHYIHALEYTPPIKLIISHRNMITTEAPEPIPYHKKRFSLFYRARLRNAL
jgi:hypothetical protein